MLHLELSEIVEALGIKPGKSWCWLSSSSPPLPKAIFSPLCMLFALLSQCLFSQRAPTATNLQCAFLTACHRAASTVIRSRLLYLLVRRNSTAELLHPLFALPTEKTPCCYYLSVHTKVGRLGAWQSVPLFIKREPSLRTHMWSLCNSFTKCPLNKVCATWPCSEWGLGIRALEKWCAGSGQSIESGRWWQWCVITEPFACPLQWCCLLFPVV